MFLMINVMMLQTVIILLQRLSGSENVDSSEELIKIIIIIVI